jgi:hypothetical protein
VLGFLFVLQTAYPPKKIAEKIKTKYPDFEPVINLLKKL